MNCDLRCLCGSYHCDSLLEGKIGNESWTSGSENKGGEVTVNLVSGASDEYLT